MNDIRSLFPVVLDRVYMDHASEGPMPAPARKAVEKLLRLYVREGKPSIPDCIEVVKETRKLAAGLLNASPPEIAFVKNTSHGIILAIASIPWRSGDNVVLLKDAFPANVYPWLNLLPDVEKRWVQLEDGVTGNGRTDVLRQFSNCVDEHTRAISLDWVHYLTGRRLELKELGAFCKQKRIFLIVDAIQGLGALQINLEQVKCDFLCAGGSKWLLSPHGTGMLYVSKETVDELRPCNIGWLSANWNNFEDFKVMPALKPGAERLEEGTFNLIGIYAMRESLKIIADMGIPRIETKVTTLIDGLAEGLVGLGCEILTPLGSALRSGILSFVPPGISTRNLWELFSESGVVCSLRGGWIRLSPHFYNTKDEIELVIDLVRAQIKA